MVKKNIDKQGLPKAAKDRLDGADSLSKADALGVAGDVVLEPVPHYVQADNEKVFEGQNNSWIVLGRDRPGDRLSGYGGKGDTQCASVDIVVGRMAHEPKSEAYVDPDFTKDSARFHLSQKSDVDRNFSLASGSVGNSIAKSSAALKADSVRIVAREGIKLVTGTDGQNSQGGSIDRVAGVDIIAGNNDETLEPMVKGESLAEAMQVMMDQIESLSGIVSSFIHSQMELNTSNASHFHTSPFFGNPTTPSSNLASAVTRAQMDQMQDCVIAMQKWKANLAIYKQNFLSPAGEKHFNSRFNKVN
jgi:hypothetical protein